MRSLNIFIVAFFLGGCASIVSKSDYPVTINSNPSGADITISTLDNQGVFSGKAPSTVCLKASKDYFESQSYTIRAELETGEAREVNLQAKTDPWYIAGNLLFGGLIGWLLVDPATGAMWMLPESVMIDFEAPEIVEDEPEKEERRRVGKPFYRPEYDGY